MELSTPRRLIGDPILREVMPEAVLGDELREIAAAVTEHSREWDRSVGLAANQIGYRTRLFVIKMDGKIDLFINPKIIRIGRFEHTDIEGCGSIPGKQFRVTRKFPVMAVWQTLDGKKKAEQMHGFKARVFQHELDHLNGILISDIGKEIHADV